MLSDPTAKSCLEALIECCKRLSSEVKTLETQTGTTFSDPTGRIHRKYAESYKATAPPFDEWVLLSRSQNWGRLHEKIHGLLDELGRKHPRFVG